MTRQLKVASDGATLVVTGTVEKVLWDSDDDPAFQDEFPDDELTEDDIPEILDYLVEEDYLTELQRGQVECFFEDEDEDEDDPNYDDDDEE